LSQALTCSSLEFERLQNDGSFNEDSFTNNPAEWQMALTWLAAIFSCGPVTDNNMNSLLVHVPLFLLLLADLSLEWFPGTFIASLQLACWH